MKKVLFAAAVLAVAVVGLGAQGKPLPLATGEWAPYTGEKLANFGYFSEIVAAAAKEAGLKADIKFYPWKRCETLLADGQVFGVFPYSATAEREKQFVFSSPVAPSTGRLFYLKSKFKNGLEWNTYADLKALGIGGVSGYWYEKEFKDAGLKVDYANDDETNVKKLQAGRIDVIAGEELVVRQLIEKLFPKEKDNFAVCKKPTNVSDMMLMVSKTYPDSAGLLAAFNDGLKKIRSNGTYAAILKKYGVSE